MQMPWAHMPRSFSVAPAPRPTERSIVQTERAVRSRDFESLDDVNAFLQSPEGQRAMETAEPAGSWESAQDVAYEAWESTGPQRYELARRALAMDDRCSDAWLILAEEERSWRKQKRCFEWAVAAAEGAAAEEGWLQEASQDEEGSLYRQVAGRTYLRAQLALARCLAEGGYVQEARILYEKLLHLDPEDHMGVRFEMLPLYHLADDWEGLRSLLDRYSDDGLASLAYEHLWLALVTGADSEEIEQLAEAARQVNPHVPSFLLGEAELPDSRPEYIHPGAEDEAASYAEMAVDWWRREPRVMAWLREQHGGSDRGSAEGGSFS